MKQTAACLLVAVGMVSAGYCASKALLPLAASCFDVHLDVPDLTPDYVPDWHFKKPRFGKPCFGFCPETEDLP
jgi:hypothetical protein